ncbi:ABC transporter ATP-binding protein [Actinomadura decatromicini]|uniref:ABC transporter ATP-binding protein n=1 Tax=Actinomadura decatromicini TaxID=2604572 RepID=A0A5D3FRS1_9ACTN|nr:ATP-binding cassette domain-containing protein [Actinomadura decatromicini]TYK51041.1 ABC transporter ATP-binding protein [Actinomadura decatromicini]
MTEPLLSIDGLTVRYPRRRGGPVTALDGVSLTAGHGRTVGLVGESGSGKSTLGKAILGLVPVDGGSITFDGRDITRAGRRERRELSGQIQVVFQDPYGSLNPVKPIGRTLGEPLRVQRSIGTRAVRDRVLEALERVGLPVAAADRYPAEFSGGQRQRVAIARALVMRPRLIVCDEPVSALDLSLQAQILNLFNELKADLGVAYLFISHDLGVVRYLADDLVVLYRGSVVESGPTRSVYDHPRAEYTKRLIAAIPRAAQAIPHEKAPSCSSES